MSKPSAAALEPALPRYLCPGRRPSIAPPVSMPLPCFTHPPVSTRPSPHYHLAATSPGLSIPAVDWFRDSLDPRSLLVFQKATVPSGSNLAAAPMPYPISFRSVSGQFALPRSSSRTALGRFNGQWDSRKSGVVPKLPQPNQARTFGSYNQAVKPSRAKDGAAPHGQSGQPSRARKLSRAAKPSQAISLNMYLPLFMVDAYELLHDRHWAPLQRRKKLLIFETEEEAMVQIHGEENSSHGDDSTELK